MSIAFTRRAALGAAFATCMTATARADSPEVSAGALRISAPWSRAAGAGATGVGYMTIRNTGGSPDRLVAARSPAARVVELHTHMHDGDVMRMRPVEAIELPPGQEVKLQPSGFHLMLINLAAPLQRGGQVAVTLVFEKAGEVEVQLSVESAGARGPSSSHGH
jgi:copper(I)-binding protein